MQENRHLTREGILEIMEIRKEMNDGGKRKHGEEEIKNHLFNEESSETIRQALPDDEER